MNYPANIPQPVLDVVAEDLWADEGYRRQVYDDKTGKPLKTGDTIVGIATVGVGRNLQDRGLSQSESRFLLRNDIVIAVQDLDRNLSWWRVLSDNRKRALVNMCFNLGWPRLSGFKNMLAALQSGDFEKASRDALDSRWADQVGDRALRIAKLIREG